MLNPGAEEEGRHVNGDTKHAVVTLLNEHPRGLTITEIADELDLTRQTTAKYVEILRAEGTIEQREIGRAKLNYLSEEVEE